MEENDKITKVRGVFTPDAVVLADGDYPSNEVACAMLQSASFVACCDGAVDEFVSRGGCPQIIVGDGDSISAELRERFSSVMVTETEQDTNDLTKTMRQLLSQGIHRIAIVGATGKREDHTLGNISLLLEYKRKGAEVRMYTDYGVFIPISGDAEFESFVCQQVSIFNFGATNMSADGLDYELSDFTSWWQGTLNQSNCKTFTIYAQGEYIVYLAYKK